MDETADGGDDPVIDATRTWLERAVIGLNLCPFAAAVRSRGLIRYVHCSATDAAALLDALAAEATRLVQWPAAQVDTTLLIHPRVLGDFVQYNDFLELAESLLRSLALEGELQIASFHPGYRFAGTRADAIENFTNRSPYPMLHLLREASVARAVAGHPDPSAIYRRNIRTLRRLGSEGWRRLWDDPPR